MNYYASKSWDSLKPHQARKYIENFKELAWVFFKISTAPLPRTSLKKSRIHQGPRKIRKQRGRATSSKQPRLTLESSYLNPSLYPEVAETVESLRSNEISPRPGRGGSSRRLPSTGSHARLTANRYSSPGMLGMEGSRGTRRWPRMNNSR